MYMLEGGGEFPKNLFFWTEIQESLPLATGELAQSEYSRKVFDELTPILSSCSRVDWSNTVLRWTQTDSETR